MANGKFILEHVKEGSLQAGGALQLLAQAALVRPGQFYWDTDFNSYRVGLTTTTYTEPFSLGVKDYQFTLAGDTGTQAVANGKIAKVVGLAASKLKTAVSTDSNGSAIATVKFDTTGANGKFLKAIDEEGSVEFADVPASVSVAGGQTPFTLGDGGSETIRFSEITGKGLTHTVTEANGEITVSYGIDTAGKEGLFVFVDSNGVVTSASAVTKFRAEDGQDGLGEATGVSGIGIKFYTTPYSETIGINLDQFIDEDGVQKAYYNLAYKTQDANGIAFADGMVPTIKTVNGDKVVVWAPGTQGFNDTITAKYTTDVDGKTGFDVQFATNSDNVAYEGTDGLYAPAVGVHSDSTAYVEIVNDPSDSHKKLIKLKALATENKISATSFSTLQDWIDSGAYTPANAAETAQLGDKLYLANGKVYQNLVGKNDTPTGTSADWILLEDPTAWTIERVRTAYESGSTAIGVDQNAGKISWILSTDAGNDAQQLPNGAYVSVANANVTTTYLGETGTDTVKNTFDQLFTLVETKENILTFKNGTKRFPNSNDVGLGGTLMEDTIIATAGFGTAWTGSGKFAFGGSLSTDQELFRVYGNVEMMAGKGNVYHSLDGTKKSHVYLGNDFNLVKDDFQLINGSWVAVG